MANSERTTDQQTILSEAEREALGAEILARRNSYHERVLGEAVERFDITPETPMVELPDGYIVHEGYLFQALRTPRQMADMGALMENAMAHYIPLVASGRSHIYAMYASSADTLPVANFEIALSSGLLAQIRGPKNAPVADAVAQAARSFVRSVER